MWSEIERNGFGWLKWVAIIALGVFAFSQWAPIEVGEFLDRFNIRDMFVGWIEWSITVIFTTKFLVFYVALIGVANLDETFQFNNRWVTLIERLLYALGMYGLVQFLEV